MMWQAEIITSWNIALRGPQLFVDYPQIDDVHGDNGGGGDATGQLRENVVPVPNLFNVVVRLSLATLNAIKADGDYMVLWELEEVVE